MDGAVRSLTRPRPTLVWLACGLLLLAALCAQWLKPSLRVLTHPPGTLEQGLPQQVDGWTQAPLAFAPVDLSLGAHGGDRSNTHPYDDVVMRRYVDANRREIVLAIAYSAEQRQGGGKVHGPELCYPAQGWEVTSWQPTAQPRLWPTRPDMQGVHMQARKADERELVFYVLRTADRFEPGAWDSRMAILRAGLRGEVPDGALIRVSMRVGAGADHLQVQQTLETFMADLLRGTSPAALNQLLGSAR